MQEEETSLKRFTVIEKLGEGSFSCVYKVQRGDDNNFYAMKKVSIHLILGQNKPNEREGKIECPQLSQNSRIYYSP
jgi:NIMA (never in mitosis gene a)-related kinase